MNTNDYGLTFEEAQAVTQPELRGPTDEELLDLGNELMGNCLPCDPDLLIAFARAVLTRWE